MGNGSISAVVVPPRNGKGMPPVIGANGRPSLPEGMLPPGGKTPAGIEVGVGSTGAADSRPEAEPGAGTGSIEPEGPAGELGPWAGSLGEATGLLLGLPFGAPAGGPPAGVVGWLGAPPIPPGTVDGTHTTLAAGAVTVTVAAAAAGAGAPTVTVTV